MEEEDEEGEDADSGSKFSVAAGSAFPCSGANTIKMISNLPKDPCERHTHKANNVPPSPAPGYFHLEGTCREFWVCREVCSTFISTKILIHDLQYKALLNRCQRVSWLPTDLSDAQIVTFLIQSRASVRWISYFLARGFSLC